MIFIHLAFALYGVYLIATRLKDYYNPSPVLNDETPLKLSIIIPARNEAHNLPTLLKSIQNQNFKNIEVIGVDDSSTDNTYALFEQYGCNCIRLKEAEKQWSGKSFACYQGSQIATGDYYLFLDADTELKEDSLQLALRHMKEKDLDLLSAIPEHKIYSLWEDFLGSFHVLLYSCIRPFQPQKNWLYCNGQFLMFRSEYYKSSGGHQSIKDVLAEDLALANHCYSLEKNYSVFPKAGLYKVRMYDSLKDFVAGWRRNFHLGFKYSNPRSSLDVFFMMYALFGAGQLENPKFAFLSLASFFLVYMQSLRLGKHSILAFLLGPIGVFYFIGISLLAVWDRLKKNNIKWKGREYIAP
jgi:glycosyltransferase involved in cell wall biosynthesis